MSTAKFIGRVGALAVALGVGFAAATVSGVAFAEPSDSSSADSTALLVCGAACPTWHDADVEIIMNQFITPTHPDQTITPVPVTTPSEIWPVTGILRLIASVTGDPRLGRPGGAAWPDEPWWKLSGLFDVTAGQSLQGGVAALEAAMAAHGNDHLVIYAYSQGAASANLEKIRLAAQYPAETTDKADAPDISFVLGGDPNLPNGGLMARFPGLYIPILDFPTGFTASTDTLFKTVEINRQYDGAADFPLYPLNVISLLNAGLGFLYLHTWPFDVSLPLDPKTSPAYQGTHGDTDYYFFHTQDLPLFAPLRQLGVPESVIDVVEPFFRVIVELGYDRSIPPWEPTPARLIPTLNPATVATDLVNAIGEGLNNAAALLGLPAPLRIPARAPAAALEDVDDAAPTNLGEADVPSLTNSTDTLDRAERAASTQPVPETEQMSTYTNASTAEMSGHDDTSELADRAERAETPRPVVRDSFDASAQLPNRPDRGDAGSTTDTTDADDEAATVESSSATTSSAASSSTDSSSSDDDSSSSDTRGSD